VYEDKQGGGTQTNRCPDRDMNAAPPEYDSEVLLHQLTCSVGGRSSVSGHGEAVRSCRLGDERHSKTGLTIIHSILKSTNF
jgi:hypothetical protein